MGILNNQELIDQVISELEAVNAAKKQVEQTVAKIKYDLHELIDSLGPLEVKVLVLEDRLQKLKESPL